MKKWWKKAKEVETPEPKGVLEDLPSIVKKSPWTFSDHEYPVTFDLAGDNYIDHFKNLQMKDEQVQKLFKNIGDPIETFTFKVAPAVSWDHASPSEIMQDIMDAKLKWKGMSHTYHIMDEVWGMPKHEPPQRIDDRPDTESEVWDE